MFEFDEAKSDSNLEKHGIDFFDAQKLWLNETVIIRAKKYYEEERFAVIGLIDLKHWTAIVTPRGKNIRIISVRRSRKDEVEIYELKTNGDS